MNYWFRDDEPTSTILYQNSRQKSSHDEEAIEAVAHTLFDAVTGAQIVREQAIDSQRNWITEALTRWCDEEDIDLILTIGGTYPAPGLSTAEIMPEATLDVVERLPPGLSEAMRSVASEETSPALLHRGVVGIRGRTLILNLPAGAQPATLFLEAVVDLIEAVVAHLRSEPTAPTIADELTAWMPADPTDDVDGEAHASGLNAEEFAAFLQKTRGGEDGS